MNEQREPESRFLHWGSDGQGVVPFRIPGDSRTRVGFLTFDSTIHFYNLQEGLSQPQMLVVSDIDGTFGHSGTELSAFYDGVDE